VHTFLFRRIGGRTENFTPGDNFTPRDQLRPWGSKFAPRGVVKNWASELFDVKRVYVGLSDTFKYGEYYK
jgi:hypothetical protein